MERMKPRIACLEALYIGPPVIACHDAVRPLALQIRGIVNGGLASPIDPINMIDLRSPSDLFSFI